MNQRRKYRPLTKNFDTLFDLVAPTTRNVIGHVIISVLFTAPRVHLEFFGSGSYN